MKRVYLLLARIEASHRRLAASPPPEGAIPQVAGVDLDRERISFFEECRTYFTVML